MPNEQAINQVDVSCKGVIVNVGLPVPLSREFDYLLPTNTEYIENSLIGRRVAVPFGPRRELVGVIVGVADSSETASDKLREVRCILDEFPIIDPEILALCRWCAKYYLGAIGEVLQLALPTLLRKAAPLPAQKQKHWRLTASGQAQQLSNFGRAKKQGQAWQLLHEQSSPSSGISTIELKSQGIGTTVLKNLLNKGLVETVEIEKSIDMEINNRIKQPESPLKLNREQQDALDAIDFSTFGCYLLEGITGSGKTEVYLQAIGKMLSQGKQVLVLVPEISLTPQTLARFQRRFTVPIALMHSGLNDTQRYLAWKAAKHQQAMLVIGTRSSIFCQMPQLGLIIVDEEHDVSYKQQEGVRYSARDLAAVRAQKLGIPLILGSATPSLETLYNALHHRYHHLKLNRRAAGAEVADITCIETKELGIAEDILAVIDNCITAHQQVLVFINRRGYAPTLMCKDCGWVSQCRRCDSKMTLHHHPYHLHCHHCDWQINVPKECNFCRSVRLEPIGQGTQRSEEQLLAQFPQVPILRIDGDTTRRKTFMQETIEIVNNDNPCILVGTQMLAKGHHFPKVTLVVVLGIDTCFFSGDFRGAERMGQLLTQVAGRAGRDKHPGQVLLQTQFGDHPLLQVLIKEGYQTFARQLLGDRKSAAMPPFYSMALIRCNAQQPNIAITFLKQARAIANQIDLQNSQVRYLGPMPAMLEKRNNRYHYHVQIISKFRRDRDRLLALLYSKLEKLKQPKGLRWTIDVDPQEA